jgi:hypothetical protein
MNLLILIVLASVAFLANAVWTKDTVPSTVPDLLDRVVVSAPLQVAMYGGDRYLAANLEAIRVGATGVNAGEANTHYLLRAERMISDLNPCHEDNYYTANALLTWAGGEQQAGEILGQAIQCRFWDEYPPFFLGFNQYFFHRNYVEAQRNIELAASRSIDRVSSFTKLAIMIKAESFKNERLAFDFLIQERDKTRNEKLRKMLDVRAERIAGLLRLRDAQDLYESQVGKKLANPGQLLESGLLRDFPKDPMNIGYRFQDGLFQMVEVKVQ